MKTLKSGKSRERKGGGAAFGMLSQVASGLGPTLCVMYLLPCFPLPFYSVDGGRNKNGGQRAFTVWPDWKNLPTPSL